MNIRFSKSQKGFSLIEALIALVILSMGLMGVAAMQLKALQSATAGYQRSVATLAAVDAQERLWAELAQLNPADDCTVIDTAYLQNVVPPETRSIEQKWKDGWNDDVASNPLRNVDWVASSITGSDCEFTITIALGDGPGDIDGDEFVYKFRLP
ncbi:type IV pilus modification protein PilV [Vreelandella massiliensis]|uniref:type IV pilus modification protein PilV n=1 Tax=Vreelandella massiliensis TaxID=1816686 RepID=UPI00096A3D07|nr:type IV pilus modification protein PilV [Halomonas massiliensis]